MYCIGRTLIIPCAEGGSPEFNATTHDDVSLSQSKGLSPGLKDLFYQSSGLPHSEGLGFSHVTAFVYVLSQLHCCGNIVRAPVSGETEGAKANGSGKSTCKLSIFSHLKSVR